jgi:hypothetical protein
MSIRRTLATATALCAILSSAACGDGDAADADAAPGDDDDPDAVTPAVPPEIDGQVTINEIMAANVYTAVDDGGISNDWVELYNPTDQDIPLHGYALTDDLGAPGKAVIDDGVILPAGGHVVLWLDGLSALADHVGLTLPRTGGTLALARPDGSFIDRITYDEQTTDLSAAREPDGSDLWKVEWHVSPGEANPAGDGEALGLEDLDAAPEAVPAAGDISEVILGYDEIPELALTISDAGMASLLAAPRTYVEATLTFDGRAYGPIGVRLKGQNSFRPIAGAPCENNCKPSLRLNINHYDDDASFFGLKDMTLNNMSGDPSMMHERLGYRVLRDAGVPASRANHAFVTINDAAYGLYANVETVKKSMLRRWFDSDEGTLFEATDVDFLPAYVASYEYELGPDDRSALTGMADAMALATSTAALAAAAAHADLAELHRYWAATAVIGQFDAFPYSGPPGDDIFVYVDPTTSKLSILPWGMDESFLSSSHEFVEDSVAAYTVHCRAVAGCLQDFADQAWDILADTEAFDLEAERARVAAQIAPFVALDTRKEYSAMDVTSYQDAIGYFIANRRGHFDEMLPPPTP